jgi:pilus assembly protein Flp/PilA
MLGNVTTLRNMLRHFIKDERGVTAIEYAVIGVVVIAVVVGVGVTFIGDLFNDLATEAGAAGT